MINRMCMYHVYVYGSYVYYVYVNVKLHVCMNVHVMKTSLYEYDEKTLGLSMEYF